MFENPKNHLKTVLCAILCSETIESNSKNQKNIKNSKYNKASKHLQKYRMTI